MNTSRSLSHLSHLALAVGFAALAVPQLSAADVYVDDFSGTGSLNGSAPDTRPGSETWTARTSAPNPILGGGLVTVTASGTSTGNLARLPFTIAADFVYELSADIDFAASSAVNEFSGIGFFTATASTTSAYSSSTPSTPWVFLRSGNAVGASVGDISLRPSGVAVGAGDTDTNLTVTDTNTFKLVLNTSDTDGGTAGNQFSLRLFINNVEVGSTFTYTAAASTALLANIGSVGFTGTVDDVSVSYDNFLLTAVPEPTTVVMLLGGLGLLLGFQRGRRAIRA